MNEKSYNLLYEGWIKVRYLDGHIGEVGFVDVLKDAHLIKGLAGELPTQDLAILRVLLAALYAIYLREDAEGRPRSIEDCDQAVGEWADIWNRSKFDPSVIEDYFKAYEERFFLFHPERPFFQAYIEKGTEYSVAKINSEVSESGNKHRLFVPLNGVNSHRMTFAQTARWLIHCVAFDDASAKQKDKSNGSVQMSVGWLGQIGPVYADGNNLFETLMLNLVLVNGEEVMSDGHPIWEKDTIGVGERVKIPLPNSPAELLTMQSRRILLKSNNGLVEEYSLVGGDIVSPINATIEQMTAWKIEKGKNEYSPKRLREDVSMWRDFSSLMIRSKGSSEGYRAPGIVNWLTLLYENNHIPYEMIKIRSTGMVYGSMFSSIQNIIDDSLSVNAQLLSDLNSGWNYRISKSIEKIDQGVKLIGSLLTDLMECDGFKRDDSNVKQRRDYVKSDAYFRMDQPFRRWLAAIVPDRDDIDESIGILYNLVRDTLLSIGKEMIGWVDSTAMIGKEKTNPSNNAKYRVNAFKSYNRFENGIYDLFRGVNENGDQ